MQETVCRRRSLPKIPKSYAGFKPERKVFAEYSSAILRKMDRDNTLHLRRIQQLLISPQLDAAESPLYASIEGCCRPMMPCADAQSGTSTP